MHKNLRIGDILIEEGLITKNQLLDALAIQKQSNYDKKLGEIFISEGLISEKELALVLADQLDMEFLDLYSVEINLNLLKNYPIQILRNADSIIFKEDEDFIHVAIADPLNYDALEILERSIVIKPIKFYIALKNDIRHIYERLEIIETAKALMNQVKQEI